MIEFDNSAPKNRVMKRKSLECKLIDFVVTSGNEFEMQMFGIDSNVKHTVLRLKIINHSSIFKFQNHGMKTLFQNTW